MNSKSLFTVLIVLLILSFMPIYPNPKKGKRDRRMGGPAGIYTEPKKVNLWRAMS